MSQTNPSSAEQIDDKFHRVCNSLIEGHANVGIHDIAPIVRRMKETLEVKSETLRMRTHKSVFTGARATSWLVTNCALSRENAVAFGQLLLDGRVFEHINLEHHFKDSKNWLYRFIAQPHEFSDTNEEDPPCAVCSNRLGTNEAVLCHICHTCVHKSCTEKAVPICLSQTALHRSSLRAILKLTGGHSSLPELTRRHSSKDANINTMALARSEGSEGGSDFPEDTLGEYEQYSIPASPTRSQLFDLLTLEPGTITSDPDNKTKVTIRHNPANESKKPLVVFINKKAGGQQGKVVMEEMQKLIGEHQVFDLSQGGPRAGLELFKDVKNHIVLGCGGDGTIGWILSVMDTIDYSKSSPPPIAILPLGTGNDLSRVLKWGPGYEGQSIPFLTMQIMNAETVLLDRWSIKIKPAGGGGVNDHQRPAADERRFVMNNYFSVGFDAQIALEFHEAREANPRSFSNRNINKLRYVKYGAQSMVKEGESLRKTMQVEVDGKIVEISEMRSVVIINIPSYSAGADIWGKRLDRKFQPQSYSDGLFEVVGLRSSLHLGEIQARVDSGVRLAQGSFIRITTSATLPMQFDGEPIRQPPSVIEIGLLSKAKMLKNSRRISPTIVNFTLSREEIERLVNSIRNPYGGLKMKTRSVGFRTVKNTFYGCEMVDFLAAQMKMPCRIVGWKTGQLLFEADVFGSLGNKTFIDGRTLYFFKGDAFSSCATSPTSSSSSDLPKMTNPFIGILKVTVVEGRGFTNSMIPGVILKCGSERMCTRSVSGPNPTWGEDFVFVINRSNGLLKLTVTSAKMKESGRQTIPIQGLREGRQDIWIPVGEYSTLDDLKISGEVRLVMDYLFMSDDKDQGSYFGPMEFIPPETTIVKRASSFMTKISQANHYACINYESVYNPYDPDNPDSGAPYITGLFQYGMYSLKGQEVEVFIQDNSHVGAIPEEWISLGRTLTDNNGSIDVPLPEKFRSKAAYWKVRAVATHDQSVAAGQLFILPRGTEVAVFDLDGTLTVGDEEVVKQFLSETVNQAKRVDLKRREGSVSLVRLWAAKGYLPVYLSGRQGSMYNLTRNWLIKHGFPPGPIVLTNDHIPTLPIWLSVGRFKRRYLQSLNDLGLKIVSGYGNTSNDIRVYHEIGLAKKDTFIVGPYGGRDKTVDLGGNFNKHLNFVLDNFPNASSPVPTNVLEW